MLKRSIFFALLCASALALAPITASADVLIEPNNSFYTRHRGECVFLNRTFYANSESGFVSMKKEPGSKAEAASVKNGEEIFILFTYDDKGELWGVADVGGPSGLGRASGWIPMDQLLLKYDYLSFEQEHSAEIYSYEESYSPPDTLGSIVMWSWPGSGETAGVIEENAIREIISISVTNAYRDEQGREWGFVGYLFGRRNFWICLSDPENGEISAFNPPPEPAIWKPGETDTRQSVPTPPILIIIMVAVVVTGTAALIRAFWKPKKD